MTLQIPNNFQVHKQALDSNETYIRDQLCLKIDQWARFRYTIHVGNEAENLYSNKSISEEVKESYRELAKSHYEVVTSLGSAHLSLQNCSQYKKNPILFFTKSVKDFYFHIGCILDNLARLIYIINDPQSATEKNQRGALVRHWVGWGSLRGYPGYTRLKKSRRLCEIRNIRNNIAHSWSCPIYLINNIPYWPLAVRLKRDHFWLYDELQIMRRKYRKWLPLVPTMGADFKFIEGLQDDVFRKLTQDVKIFESNYNVVIQ
jgi:hypothetical protein